MSLLVAVVADDLTGALDTATPFVDAGLRVVVPLGLAGVANALAADADVIAVPTASRALDEGEAAGLARTATAELMRGAPAVMFKKVDSRLKGNVAAETAAVKAASGRRRLLVSPGVPDQGRRVEAGHVVGRGVAAPIPIAPRLSGLIDAGEIADAGDDADYDRLVDAVDWSATLAVGARGLGQALARRFARAGGPPRPAPKVERTLFAIGSRDPITVGQIERLLRDRPGLPDVASPAGEVPGGAVTSLPAVVRCAGVDVDDADGVARRFAAGIAGVVRGSRPDMLVLSGGDTALAVLTALGVTLVVPGGEAAAGVPWSTVETADGQRLAVSVKSGGFGGPDVLVGLLPSTAAEPTTVAGAPQ